MINTPYFLISEKKLKKNIEAFQNALDKIWPNSKLAYSVKTNSLPWLLKYLYKQNIMAEVVSDEEYKLALLCGYDDKNVIFNGPIKGTQMLKSALQRKAYVNIDSKNDLECIKKVEPDGSIIGIRVNVDPKVFEKNDIEYQEEGFRFGFSEKNGQFSNAVEIVRKHSTNTRFGLHLHCNSITRSLDVYKSIAKYAVGLITKYRLDVALFLS